MHSRGQVAKGKELLCQGINAFTAMRLRSLEVPGTALKCMNYAVHLRVQRYFQVYHSIVEGTAACSDLSQSDVQYSCLGEKTHLFALFRAFRRISLLSAKVLWPCFSWVSFPSVWLCLRDKQMPCMRQKISGTWKLKRSPGSEVNFSCSRSSAEAIITGVLPVWQDNIFHCW